MLNPLRRLTRRDPYVRARIQPMPITPRTGDMLIGPADDYHVEGVGAGERPSAGSRLIQGLQVAVIFVVAILSFAVFWLIGVMLNIF
jgi:hypothetical protein